jgi:hypothetical protein
VHGQKTNARRRGFRGIKTKIERCQILSVSGGKIPPHTVFTRSKLDAPPQRVIFVLPTLNPPAALWSFDQAHTTCDANQLIINFLQRLAAHGGCAWSKDQRTAARLSWYKNKD